MRDTPPYEEHGAADATSIRHAARLILVYSYYLADGADAYSMHIVALMSKRAYARLRIALMHIRCISLR